MTPRIGASGARGSTARAPGLDFSGVNPEPRTGASEATGRIRQKDAPELSCQGGMKHNNNPGTGSSRGETGATDWGVQGGGESTTKRPPGLEQPGGMKHGASPRTGSSGGEPGAEDWSGRGNGENTIKRRPGLERPGREEARH